MLIICLYNTLYRPREGNMSFKNSKLLLIACILCNFFNAPQAITANTFERNREYKGDEMYYTMRNYDHRYSQRNNQHIARHNGLEREDGTSDSISILLTQTANISENISAIEISQDDNLPNITLDFASIQQQINDGTFILSNNISKSDISSSINVYAQFNLANVERTSQVTNSVQRIIYPVKSIIKKQLSNFEKVDVEKPHKSENVFFTQSNWHLWDTSEISECSEYKLSDSPKDNDFYNRTLQNENLSSSHLESDCLQSDNLKYCNLQHNYLQFDCLQYDNSQLQLSTSDVYDINNEAQNSPYFPLNNVIHSRLKNPYAQNSYVEDAYLQNPYIAYIKEENVTDSGLRVDDYSLGIDGYSSEITDSTKPIAKKKITQNKSIRENIRMKKHDQYFHNQHHNQNSQKDLFFTRFQKRHSLMQEYCVPKVHIQNHLKNRPSLQRVKYMSKSADDVQSVK